MHLKIERGSRFKKVRRLLYEKYPQYPEEVALDEGDVIVELTPRHVFSWGLDRHALLTPTSVPARAFCRRDRCSRGRRWEVGATAEGGGAGCVWHARRERSRRM